MSDADPKYDRSRSGWTACAYGAAALGALALVPSLPSLHQVAVLGGYSGNTAWLWVALPVGVAVLGLLTVVFLLWLGAKVGSRPLVMLGFGFALVVGADGYVGATTAMLAAMVGFPLATLAAILAVGRARRLGVFQ